MAEITVVIPVREGGTPAITLSSLAQQTFQNFDLVICQDEVGNANWARNRGAEWAHTEFILFSDDDIDWLPNALALLVETLRTRPEANYAYGAYRMGDVIQCDKSFSSAELKRHNYISTMSLIRTRDFPGFDEFLARLQDYDLWLTMLEQGKMGVYCGAVLFETQKRFGITYGSGQTYDEALAIVRQKHGLG